MYFDPPPPRLSLSLWSDGRRRCQWIVFCAYCKQIYPFCIIVVSRPASLKPVNAHFFPKEFICSWKISTLPYELWALHNFFLHALENIWWRLLKLLAFISANVGFLLRVFFAALRQSTRNPFPDSGRRHSCADFSICTPWELLWFALQYVIS